MTANDLRDNTIINVARRLALVFAVTLTMCAKAKTQATPQAQAQTQSLSQTSTAPGDGSTEKIAGNYAVQQSIEFGYRDSMIDGNINNYGTFVNLFSGMRLFDYTLDMRSIDHRGLFFDNLSFANTGYGGDPNDVSRLHVDKNKWYDFRAMFRRDKNFWNYNLLANPLNGSTGPINGVAIGNSPHALDLSRRMQDYDLTLMPQSRVRVRLGYSRNVNTGPASTTLEGGTDTALLQSVSEITNSYRMGVDYRGFPGTTLSFDETIIHSAVNNSATDNNLIYQLSNGTPVDLGIVFVGTTPCANPITNAATAPPTVTANCNGYLSYSQVQNPRSTFPTERFSFQSTYFKNLSMAGSASYSSGDNTVSGFNEAVNGWATRTLTRGSTTGGPAQAKRISVNTNWSGNYRVTDKLSIFDQFSYENWRIPSMWATAETNLFATPPQAGQSGLLLPIAMITPSTFTTLCPTAPYNGPNCPQHNASSGADVTNELVSQFLGQNIRSNTIELRYEFTPRVSAYVGYEFTARTIADFSATWDTGEIYLPGGVGGKPGILQGAAPPAVGGNYYFAARGDCAVIVATGALPAGCTYNPANGSIQEGSSTNLLPETGNDTVRNIYDIHENAGLVGVSARPIDTLRLNADLMFGYNDNSFTRISPRQLQSYKFRANYTPRPWASLGVNVDIHENRDNVAMVNNIEHDRTYSVVATFSPKSSLYVDVGYNYMDIYTQTEICFPDTGSTIFTTPCPIAGASSPLETLSFYSSRDNYAYGDVMWKPHKRVTVMAGYGGSIVRGDTTFLNPLTPTGTLDFNYIKPFASLAFDVYRGLIYKTAWNYYGYNDHGVANPAGLAALPSQDFNGNNVTFSFRYSF
jgi:hypothetical protein